MLRRYSSSSLSFVSLVNLVQAENILNSKAGWKSLTGTTDFGLITRRAQEGSEVDKLAFNLFADRILNYIGSYHLKLDGQMDAIVFSGGIGERSKELRKAIGEKLQCLGFQGVSDEANQSVDSQEGVVFDITARPTETKKILVCRTDEQVSAPS